MKIGVNQDEAISIPLFNAAVITNPAGQDSTSFNLDTLGTHNIVEHDASLRQVLRLPWYIELTLVYLGADFR